MNPKPDKGSAPAAAATPSLSSVTHRIKRLKDAQDRLDNRLKKSRKQFFQLADQDIEDRLHPTADPATIPFEHPIEGTNKKLIRYFATRGSAFDVERFRKDHPDLASSVLKSRVIYEMDEEAAQTLIDEHPELRAIFQEYAIEGKLEARMRIVNQGDDE